MTTTINTESHQSTIPSTVTDWNERDRLMQRYTRDTKTHERKRTARSIDNLGQPSPGGIDLSNGASMKRNQFNTQR